MVAKKAAPKKAAPKKAVKKNKDGFEKNIEKMSDQWILIKNELAANGHIERYKNSSWIGGLKPDGIFGTKESKFHTGLNLWTEALRVSPYWGSHITFWGGSASLIAMILMSVIIVVGLLR